MKRDVQVCNDCRTKVLARPLGTRPPNPTSASGLSTSLSAPTSNMSSTSNNNQQGNQKGSNYFFGILFSVAILILMCATCGIGSRARFFIRRRHFQREIAAREWRESEMVLNRPRLHEVRFVNAEDVRWRSDVMPLSVSYLHDKMNQPTKEGESTENLNPTPLPPSPSPSPSPPTSPRIRSQKPKIVSAAPKLEQPVVAIRTLTLIVMPSLHRDRRLGVDDDADHHQSIMHPDPTTMSSGLQIGVETLPWDRR